MSRHVSEKVLAARAEVTSPPAPRACEDHSFEMPAAIYGTMAALFVGFVGVLCFALRNSELVVPFGVFVAFIGAFFVVPAIAVRASPKNERRAPGWIDFLERGIAIEHGSCTGAEAVVLSLLLPTFIFLWAIAIATIVALI